MDKKKKLSFFKLPSTRVTIRYLSVALVMVLILTSVLPIILNYPPDSLNNAFDIYMSGIPFVAQISIIYLLCSALIFCTVKFLFRPIDSWYKDTNPKKINDKKRIQKIREKCFSLPYIIFSVECFLPIACSILVLAFTGSHPPIMIFKILMLFVSFFLLFSVASYIFSKDFYTTILKDIYDVKSEINVHVSLKSKIWLQVLPISIMGILLTALIAYNQVIKTEENFLFNSYHRAMNECFDSSVTYDSGNLVKIFSEFELAHYSHSKFMIKPDGSVLTISGFEPSNFLIEYTKYNSGNLDGRTYDGYGIDTQGTTIKVNTEQGVYTLGIMYSIDSSETIVFLLMDFLFTIFVTIVSLSMFANSLHDDIKTVSDSLFNISNSSSNTKLPILSNDEIGDLCVAYNKVQELNDQNIDQIKSSQDLLIECERLASLGQMVGGIAHNLKTPIMSIAGADEALTQLVQELDASIGNPIVTNEDFHDIAKDMQEWIDKIKTHTSYMSDVITAVKGQAVTMSDVQVFSFSTSDLFKQVDILMRHELKSALVNLNIKNKVPDNRKISGNINSLVQVLNNMISNSIQAYNGEPDKNIDLIAQISDNKLELIVRDYGPGLPKVVQENLFKKMITTKGKSGTGLGLFMSYSNIKAHFHGDMRFVTKEGKGTSFIITLPFAD